MKKKVFVICDNCHMLQDERCCYEFKCSGWVMLESVCLACLLKLRKDMVDNWT